MTPSGTARIASGGLPGWVRSVVYGVALGLCVAALMHVGAWQILTRPLVAFAELCQRTVGPVWVPMALVGARVLWLAGRAARTRLGKGPFGRAVRPELQQLAPLFAAFGLAGTVWGLRYAFAALEGGEFLDQLPTLLTGLGAAMTSTLVGLTLQILTLLIAAYNPTWSLATVTRLGEHEVFGLDGATLGRDAKGMAHLLETLDARQPEALHLHLDPGLSEERRAELHTHVWKQLEASIPLRPPQPPALHPAHVLPPTRTPGPHIAGSRPEIGGAR